MAAPWERTPPCKELSEDDKVEVRLIAKPDLKVQLQAKLPAGGEERSCPDNAGDNGNYPAVKGPGVTPKSSQMEEKFRLAGKWEVVKADGEWHDALLMNLNDDWNMPTDGGDLEQCTVSYSNWGATAEAVPVIPTATVKPAREE